MDPVACPETNCTMQSYMGYNHITIKTTMCAFHKSMSHQNLEAKKVNSELYTRTLLQATSGDMYTTEDMSFDHNRRHVI